MSQSETASPTSSTTPAPAAPQDPAGRANGTLAWAEASSAAAGVAEALGLGRTPPDGVVRALSGSSLVVFTGAGSSYFLAQVAASAFRELTAKPAFAAPLSDLLLRPESVLPAGSATRQPVVLISRSGETSEALAAARSCRAAGHLLIGVTCRPASALASEVDILLGVPAADEQAVVMTRSFTAMTTLLLRLAALVGSQPGGLRAAEAAGAGRDLDRLPGRWAETASAAADAWRLVARPWDRLVALGGGARHGVALELSLKLLETGQVSVDAYEPLEFRHGPRSVLRPGVLVVTLPGGPGAESERAVAFESSRDGATSWILGPAAAGGSADRHTDWGAGATIIETTSGEGLHHLASLPLLMPPLQALALGVACARGLDPDRPRLIGHVVVLEPGLGGAAGRSVAGGPVTR